MKWNVKNDLWPFNGKNTLAIRSENTNSRYLEISSFCPTWNFHHFGTIAMRPTNSYYFPKHFLTYWSYGQRLADEIIRRSFAHYLNNKNINLIRESKSFLMRINNNYNINDMSNWETMLWIKKGIGFLSLVTFLVWHLRRNYIPTFYLPPTGLKNQTPIIQCRFQFLLSPILDFRILLRRT